MNLLLNPSLGILIFILVQILILLTNSYLIKNLSCYKETGERPLISVLIPARNEEENIKKCVDSFINQDYENLEIIVLDDNSTDMTLSILKKLKSEKLKIIHGESIPDNWIGKNWACHQLSEYSKGKYLFFTDADTFHHKKTLSYAISAMSMGNIDLMTAIIKMELKSFGEKITIPITTWSILTILPLFIAYLFPKSKWLLAANGKFMLFRKNAYETIGGHKAIKDEIVDDMALGKLIKKSGLKWRIFDASNLVSSRMYNGFKESLQGFTKNFFGLFEYKIIVSSFIWYWMLNITFHPIFEVIFLSSLKHFSLNFFISSSSIFLFYLLWLFTSVKSKLPKHIALLYPLIILTSVYINFRSMIFTLTGRIKWKGRNLQRRKLKFI
jgi:chlorobactene glucosyltransferase